jgi:hypothetical protein
MRSDADGKVVWSTLAVQLSTMFAPRIVGTEEEEKEEEEAEEKDVADAADADDDEFNCTTNPGNIRAGLDD